MPVVLSVYASADVSVVACPVMNISVDLSDDIPVGPSFCPSIGLLDILSTILLSVNPFADFPSIYALPWPLTCSLIYMLNRPLICRSTFGRPSFPLICSSSCPLTCPLRCPLTCPSVFPLTCPLTCLLTCLLINPLSCPLMHPLICRLTCRSLFWSALTQVSVDLSVDLPVDIYVDDVR